MKIFLAILISTMAFTASTAEGKSSLSTSELYSETSYREEARGVATQSRLRHHSDLSVLPRGLTAFVGFSVDREFEAETKGLMIENSVSPQMGLMYKPFAFASSWIEYRQRLVSATEAREGRSESDPRAGIALGWTFHHAKGWGSDVYAESVWIPRLSSGPVVAGFARTFARATSASLGDFDLYTELNEYVSPAGYMGETRTQLRLGTRWSKRIAAWSAGLYLYRPWKIERGALLDRDFEGLFVLGGTF